MSEYFRSCLANDLSPYLKISVEDIMKRLRVNYTESDAQLMMGQMSLEEAAMCVMDVTVYGRALQILNYHRMRRNQSEVTLFHSLAIDTECEQQLNNLFKLEADRCSLS